jgi:general secretion pathway protein G
MLPRVLQRRRPYNRGFTLLELIVVITIIGLLGTLVVTKVIPVIFRAQRTKILADLKTIVDAAKQRKIATGSYPETLEELLQNKDEEGNEIIGSIERLEKDPWGNEYQYGIDDEGEPYAKCLGKDETEGGEGDDEDLVWPPPDESY